MESHEKVVKKLMRLLEKGTYGYPLGDFERLDGRSVGVVSG